MRLRLRLFFSDRRFAQAFQPIFTARTAELMAQFTQRAWAPLIGRKRTFFLGLDRRLYFLKRRRGCLRQMLAGVSQPPHWQRHGLAAFSHIEWGATYRVALLSGGRWGKTRRRIVWDKSQELLGEVGSSRPDLISPRPLPLTAGPSLLLGRYTALLKLFWTLMAVPKYRRPLQRQRTQHTRPELPLRVSAIDGLGVYPSSVIGLRSPWMASASDKVWPWNERAEASALILELAETLEEFDEFDLGALSFEESWSEDSLDPTPSPLYPPERYLPPALVLEELSSWDAELTSLPKMFAAMGAFQWRVEATPFWAAHLWWAQALRVLLVLPTRESWEPDALVSPLGFSLTPLALLQELLSPPSQLPLRVWDCGGRNELTHFVFKLGLVLQQGIFFRPHPPRQPLAHFVLRTGLTEGREWRLRTGFLDEELAFPSTPRSPYRAHSQAEQAWLYWKQDMRWRGSVDKFKTWSAWVEDSHWSHSALSCISARLSNS